MSSAVTAKSGHAAPADATVYVVDDDPSIRRLVTWLMEREGVRVASFASAEAFLKSFRPNGPACLVLDLTLSGMSGLDLQARLKADAVQLPILFMSATADIPRAVEAVKQGAVDFVVKPFDYRKLVDLTHDCLRRSAERRQQRYSAEAHIANMAALTPREREVMDHVVAGKLNRMIADELAVSIKTVEAHRARIMEKLQVGSVAELVKLAVVAREGPPAAR
jgi:FixJ family two-component response regulator